MNPKDNNVGIISKVSGPLIVAKNMQHVKLRCMTLFVFQKKDLLEK